MGRSCDAQKRHTPTFKLDDHLSLGTMHPNNDEIRQTAVFDDIFDVDDLPAATSQGNLPDTDDEDLLMEEINPTGYQPNEEAQTSPHSTNPVQDSDEEMARRRRRRTWYSRHQLSQ
ncbi:hypothetical protein QTG54_015813 [Skeletonema marinoi]|uniref:Uncharacterized protein n=1 Tax=Skeletonema marinoi TaxID=267567 RepID=A0AAD8XUB2_9STRA|nr:hypothetical protein QTG54_015813 [Skeletonema marinoi]